jgi:diguanylate cyclase (GGDEF)-like protein
LADELMSFLNKSRSMFSVLVVPLVLQMVLLATIVGALSFYTGRSAVEEFLDQRMRDLVEGAEQNIRAQLDKSDLLAQGLGTGAQAYGAEFSDPVATENLLFQLTAITPFVNFIYVGAANGDFIGVDRLPDRTVVHVKNQDTAGKKLVYNSRRAGERGEIIPAMSKPYDTLARPWYKLAAEKKAPVWTPVYLSSSKNILEVTKAVPVLDAKSQVVGVIGSDLPLSQISDYLRDHAISEHGVAYVMETTGALIASSAEKSNHINSESGQQLLRAVESADPLIRLTAQHIQDKLPTSGSRKNFRFVNGDKTIEVSAKGMNAEQGLNWVTIVAAPRSDFMSNIVSNTWRTALISLGALAAAILLGVMVLHWITRDLQRLSAAATQFSGKETMETALPASRLIEVNALSNSLTHMTSRVRESMQTISAKNEQLAVANQNMEQLLHKLNLDALTGLYNRQAMLDRLQKSMQQHRHNDIGEKIALLYLDLDEFKFTNDNLGHAAGDKVLIETANRLKNNTRDQDTVARMGGDEFVLVLPHLTSAEQAQTLAQKILHALNQPILLDSGSIVMRASIGIALFPDHATEASELAELADQAMYVAKSKGKNISVLWKA